MMRTSSCPVLESRLAELKRHKAGTKLRTAKNNQKNEAINGKHGVWEKKKERIVVEGTGSGSGAYDPLLQRKFVCVSASYRPIRG